MGHPVHQPLDIYKQRHHVQFQPLTIKNVGFRANLILGVRQKNSDFENFTKENQDFCPSAARQNLTIAPIDLKPFLKGPQWTFVKSH